MTTLTLDERIQRNPDAGLAALDWATAYADELAVACKAVGVSPLEFGGLLVDAAMFAALRGDLDVLTPRCAVKRAVSAAREAAKGVVARGHKGRPSCVSLDFVPEVELAADVDPIEAILATEVEREREDLNDDHDDRPSIEAQRCARGLPPVPPRTRHQRRRDNAVKRAAPRFGKQQHQFCGCGWEV